MKDVTWKLTSPRQRVIKGSLSLVQVLLLQRGPECCWWGVYVLCGETLTLSVSKSHSLGLCRCFRDKSPFEDLEKVNEADGQAYIKRLGVWWWRYQLQPEYISCDALRGCVLYTLSCPHYEIPLRLHQSLLVVWDGEGTPGILMFRNVARAVLYNEVHTFMSILRERSGVTLKK